MQTTFQMIIALLTVVLSLLTIADKVPDVFRKLTKKSDVSVAREDYSLIHIGPRAQTVFVLLFVVMSSFLAVTVVHSSLEERKNTKERSYMLTRIQNLEGIIQELRAENTRIIRNSLK